MNLCICTLRYLKTQFWKGMNRAWHFNLIKFSNGNTKKMRKICSKLIIKTPERRRSGVFVVNFEQISYVALVFPWSKCRLIKNLHWLEINHLGKSKKISFYFEYLHRYLYILPTELTHLFQNCFCNILIFLWIHLRSCLSICISV